MFATVARAIFGTTNERIIKKFQKDVDAINALEPEFEKLKDTQLQAKTVEFRNRLEKGETLDQLLPEAFATVRETIKRLDHKRLFDVQMIGGISLHKGMIAEMKTGEGKTFVAVLASYLNALPEKGVHVVTVNDYLAARDSQWVAPFFAFLGMSVGSIVHGLSDEERREAYACDITYGTNNEYGFDYLRDNMKFRLEHMVQRGFNFAVVDEVDSILIDEARTPLIISGPAESSSELYIALDKIIPQLSPDDYEVDEKVKSVALNEQGQENLEQLLKKAGLLEGDNLYDAQNINIVHHSNQALRAHALFHRDTDYIVKDGKVMIIDEFTGRMMEGRRYSEGLHQALEAKEKVDIEDENQTLASITFQNYFRLYPKLSGMTGTAMTEASEFAEIYGLDCVEIPTNVPIQRNDRNDQIFTSLDDKFQAMLGLIKECQSRKQPVLVGTTSIDKSEKLSAALKKLGIKHQVLNARWHEQEASIIAQAGRLGAVTIATNMAGRGTDIQLGGNLEMRLSQEVDEKLSEAKKKSLTEKIKAEIAADKKKVLEAGGLYVIGTERHESRRIDNQLRGRSGRQGDPGASVFFLSLEDDLMRIFGAERLQPLLAHKQIGLKEGEALEHPLISKTLERAQRKVESQNFEIRKNLLKFDNVMNDQRKIIYGQRREVMDSDSVADVIEDMRLEVIERIVQMAIPKNAYPENWDTDLLHAETRRIFNLDLPFTDWAKEEGIAEAEILERLTQAVTNKMNAKRNKYGDMNWQRLEKAMLLQQLDQSWKEHLLALDHLRQGISLRAFGQRDPLNEYKTEAFEMFAMMLDAIEESTVQVLSLIEMSVGEDNSVSLNLNQEPDASKLSEGRGGSNPLDNAESPEQETNNVTPIRTRQKPAEMDPNNPETWGRVSRNTLCPCGSGKKYKHCHGQVSE
ncbi:MAG: preprotein translocase subunit SecA [Micavibrio sp.]|nr:preprotein translocase subunit SecA [Micavibrio sp.]|tara:strand:+ start:191 stop:2938 length:2748 start_codon:yes stop_codon:yes gene_type:complete